MGHNRIDRRLQTYESGATLSDANATPELSPEAATLLEEARRLLPMQQRRMSRGVSEADAVLGTLTPKQQMYVLEYCTDLNRERAARSTGYDRKFGPLKWTKGRVQRAIDVKLLERAERTELDSDYVREYIKSVLDLCPTDYFTIGEDGDWMIDPEQFRQLPMEVKRLVDGVELRQNKLGTFFKVNFLSKAAALAMAAKFTLVQKHAVATAQVPWDELVEEIAKDAEDPIAQRIRRELEASGAPGSVQADQVPVAEGGVVRPAEGDSPLSMD